MTVPGRILLDEDLGTLASSSRALERAGYTATALLPAPGAPDPSSRRAAPRLVH